MVLTQYGSVLYLKRVVMTGPTGFGKQRAREFCQFVQILAPTVDGLLEMDRRNPRVWKWEETFHYQCGIRERDERDA